MRLTQLDMEMLRTIAKYYVLTRSQAQQICCVDHASGRSARKRLLRLQNAGYIVKHSVPVALPGTNGAAPVYYPTQKGSNALASYFDDERFYATNTKTPRADRLAHWIAINSTRMLIERAAAATPDVKLVSWITEWECINKDAAESEQFCLHTQLFKNPPLSCSPDAGFLIRHGDESLVYYLENDLGTSSPKQIAARKSKGYDELARREGHRKHFPETTIPYFRVLFVTTTQKRAEKTQREMHKCPGRESWMMINEKTITEDNFFTAPIAIDHEGKLGPLLILPAPSSVLSTDMAASSD